MSALLYDDRNIGISGGDRIGLWGDSCSDGDVYWWSRVMHESS